MGASQVTHDIERAIYKVDACMDNEERCAEQLTATSAVESEWRAGEEASVVTLTVKKAFVHVADGGIQPNLDHAEQNRLEWSTD